jgi:hypothetical protein
MTWPATGPTIAATASQAAKSIASQRHGLMPTPRPHALENVDCLFTNALTIVRADHACLGRKLHDAITLRCQEVSSAKAATPPPGTTHATAPG